jgi:hypothetical protein
MKAWKGVIVATLAVVSGQSPKTQTAKEAHAFLATLTADQRKRAIDPQALTDWHYVPRDRKGIAWGSMNAEQQRAAHALLKSALSKIGYEKVETIRALETTLREMENGNPGRDPVRYFFLFFGEPSDVQPWAWRYEGHHLSLTFAYRDGQLMASTPQFLGSNPAEVAGKPRVLAKEQDLAFTLVKALTPAQLTKAWIGGEAPWDIVTGAARTAAIAGRKGVPYRDLDAAQRKMLLDLLRAHAEVQSEKEQARRMKSIEREELEDLVFAWMGPLERRARHYYRIQGRSLVVEYDNTQPDGNHIHTVWRNLKEDFGQDALLEHYHHGHKHSHR